MQLINYLIYGPGLLGHMHGQFLAVVNTRLVQVCVYVCACARPFVCACVCVCVHACVFALVIIYMYPLEIS